MAQKTNSKKSNTKKTTGKKNTSSKTAQRKTVQPAPVKKDRTVLGFCITAAVTLLLLFLLVFKDMAFFGKIMRPFMCGLVGEWGLTLLPAYLINLLITWFKDRRNDKVASKWMFTAVNYLSVIMIIHRLTATREGINFGADMWTIARSGYGTGLIGGNAYTGLAAFMGTAATITVLILLVFITLPFLFDSNPIRVIRSFVKGVRTIALQITDEDVEDAEEITAAVPLDRPRRPVKRTVPLTEEKKTPARRTVAQIDDELYEDPHGEITPLPKQAEINRTRKPKDNVEEQTERSEIEERPAPVIEQTAEVNTEKTQASVTQTVPPVKETVTEEAVSDKKTEPVKPFEEQPVKPAEEEKEEPKVETETLKAEEKAYVLPPTSLLVPKDPTKEGFSPDEVKRTSEQLVQTLAEFGVRASVVNTCCGPTVTRYEVSPDAGVRVKSIANLSDDIALHLAATSIRMEAPIPGKAAVGIEIPNKNKNIVRLRELIETDEFKYSEKKLLCCLGMDVVGNPVFLDVEKMPHLLIAGATGMGKSVCINSLIVSLLYRADPKEVKLILIDPKKVEFSDYSGIPHLLVPVVTEPKKAAGTLNWAVLEMEKRFSEIQDVGAKNLEEYNELTADDPEKEYIPQVVIVIDELADLMMTAPSEVENSICRLAQKARAAGMYLIIGTQRPSVDVITGLIKSNIPSRIACKVASQVDSRTILDNAGAEKLMGSGDMLYNPVGTLKPRRVQGAFVSGREVISVCTYLKGAAEANYSEDIIALIEKEAQLCGEKPSKRGSGGGAVAESGGAADSYEMQVIELAIECDTISTSLIQRRLSIGYSRAARIIDKLEQSGYVGPFDPAAKKRKVLITKEEFMEMKLNAENKSGADGGEE